MVLVRVLALAAGASALAARNVKVDGQKFVVAATGEEIVLSGPNVVVKGPPWLPSVAGEGLRRPRARLPLTRGAFIARPRGVLTTPMNLHLNLPLPLGDAILSTSASTTAVINDSSIARNPDVSAASNPRAARAVRRALATRLRRRGVGACAAGSFKVWGISL
jgi:hypothetical protein